MGELIRFDFKAKRPMPANDEAETNLDGPSQEKLDYFNDLIAKTKTSTIVNTKRPDVKLPEHLKEQGEAIIDWSYGFGLDDFFFDQEGVRGTLTFNRQPFYVVLPWDAIKIIRDAKNLKTSRKFDSTPEQFKPTDLTGPGRLMLAELETRLSAGTLAALLQNLPPNNLSSVVMIPVLENKNEIIRPSPSGVAPNFISRFAGFCRRWFVRVFGKRV